MINHLKGLEINSIYDFDNAFSINELLCKFWEKIEETINISNESIDILNWIKEQALADEVQVLINQLVADGTIEQMINVDKLNELRNLINTNYDEMLVNHTETSNKISDIGTQLDTKANLNSSSVPFKICKDSKYIIDDNIYLYFGDEATLTKNTFYTFKNGEIKLVKDCVNDINNINYYVDSFCGDNDTQKIKTGIEFINYKGGGNLLFSAKRYWLDEEIIISNDNVSLIGGVESGQKTIICPNYGKNLNSMIVIDGQKMCIKDIVFSCNGLDSIYKTNAIFNRGYFTRIDNCTFDRCKTGVINYAITNILNCDVSLSLIGVELNGTESIIDNLHCGALFKGIICSGNGHRITNCKIYGDNYDNNIKNVFPNDKQYWASQYGIEITGELNLITGNYIDTIKHCGISINNFTSSVEPSLMRGNVISNNSILFCGHGNKGNAIVENEWENNPLSSAISIEIFNNNRIITNTLISNNMFVTDNFVGWENERNSSITATASAIEILAINTEWDSVIKKIMINNNVIDERITRKISLNYSNVTNTDDIIIIEKNSSLISNNI